MKLFIDKKCTLDTYSSIYMVLTNISTNSQKDALSIINHDYLPSIIEHCNQKKNNQVKTEAWFALVNIIKQAKRNYQYSVPYKQLIQLICGELDRDNLY